MRKFLLSLLLLCILTDKCFANEVQEKMYLTQILNQFNAMQPLIIAARNAQPSNTRIQFHYTKYRDSTGHLQNGLLEDIQTIKAGITQKLNNIQIEPRVFAPLRGDYIAK